MIGLFTYTIRDALLGGKLVATYSCAFDPLLTLCELTHFIV